MLYGGAGKDLLHGGGGGDELFGGSGADRFVFKSHLESPVYSQQIIRDFNVKERDKIDLSFMDADITTAGRQDFHFIGKAAYTGNAGDLRYQKSADTTVIAADIDGDSKTDFIIRFDHSYTVTKDFFLL